MSQPDEDPPFGRYLRSAITDAGFRSPTAFARTAGVEPSVVLRWISGKAKPTTRTLAAVAPVLKVSSADLVRAAYPDEVTDERPRRVRRRQPRSPTPEALVEGSGSDLPQSEPVDLESEFATLAGLVANLHRLDPQILGALLHRSGLPFDDVYELVMAERAEAVDQLRGNWQRLAEAIRERGGTVDVGTWPPWLEAPPIAEEIQRDAEGDR